MRGTTMVALLGTALIAPGIALAGDKAQSSMVNPIAIAAPPPAPLTGPIGVSWQNGVSKGKSGGDTKCKVAVQLGGLVGIQDTDGVPGTGDEVICIADNLATQLGVPVPFSVSMVSRGEVKGGKVKIKHDLSIELPGLCVPAGLGSNTVNFANNTACYEADGAYAPPLFAPMVSDPTQGIVAGGAPRPASPMIATEGLYFQ